MGDLDALLDRKTRRVRELVAEVERLRIELAAEKTMREQEAAKAQEKIDALRAALGGTEAE